LLYRFKFRLFCPYLKDYKNLSEKKNAKSCFDTYVI
jgi:hypothetical protein